MCAKTRLGPRRPPLGHLPETLWLLFGCFWATKRSQNCKKNCTKNYSIFGQFLNEFWTSLPFLDPKPSPESIQKLDQNWTKKGLPRGMAPRWTPRPVYAAISSFWHTQKNHLEESSLHSVRKRTPFRPRWTKVRGYAAISSLWHTLMKHLDLSSLHYVRKRTPFRPRCSKMAPRCPKIASRCPQDGPTWPQDAP